MPAWTKEVPSLAGWYWYRGDHFCSMGKPVVMEVEDIGSIFKSGLQVWVPYMDYSDSMRDFMDGNDCEWFGPLEVPA